MEISIKSVKDAASSPKIIINHKQGTSSDNDWCYKCKNFYNNC